MPAPEIPHHFVLNHPAAVSVGSKGQRLSLSVSELTWLLFFRATRSSEVPSAAAGVCGGLSRASQGRDHRGGHSESSAGSQEGEGKKTCRFVPGAVWDPDSVQRAAHSFCPKFTNS